MPTVNMLPKFKALMVENEKIDYKSFIIINYKTMETVFEKPMDELDEAKNLIKQLEEKIRLLECDIKEHKETISAIEDNMESCYVENWTVTDSDGKKGEFYGNIRFVKGCGTLYYKDKTYFEGDWDSTGEINCGELRRTHTDELLAKWEDGEEIDLEDED
jgi:hypothetical protein